MKSSNKNSSVKDLPAQSKTHKLFVSKIDISTNVRVQICQILNQELLNLLDLVSQSQLAHWNVRGPQFYSFHKLFDEVTANVEKHVDDLAERITALGGLARAGIRDVAQGSTLSELKIPQISDLDYVRVLAKAFSQIAKSVRAAIAKADRLGDVDTADLLTGISRDLDKSLWLLEAHFQ